MSTRFACRGIPGRLAGLIILAQITGFLAAGSATAGVAEDAELRPFFAVTGLVSASVDAGGSVSGVHSLAVEKPSRTATVFAAFVFAASHSFREIVDGDVLIDGVPIEWLGSAVTFLPETQDLFFNVRGDVTEVVAPKVDAAEPGPVFFNFEEVGDAGAGRTIDGEILAVIFVDPEQSEERMVLLAFGGSSAAGDSLLLTLKEPIDPAMPGAVADFGLGISASSSEPDRIVVVNDRLLASAAGGEDDGGPTPGSRITVGGVGDVNTNPDPDNPSLDDELYDLLPFFDPALDRYRVATARGQQGIDNLFFAYFVVSEFAALDAGIFLDPETAANEIATEHTLTATAFDADGEPAADAEVTFRVLTGPNAGESDTFTTDADGVATFTYSGTGGPGVDTIVASFVDELGDTVSSNLAVKEWIDVLEVELTPETATREVGEEHGVAAAVTGSDGTAAEGVTVDFAVTSGPNAGTVGTGVTGKDGIAPFAYLGLGGAGGDVIVASVTDALGQVRTSNEATVVWTVPVLDEPRPDVAADDDGNILVVGEAGDGLFDVVAAFLDRDGALTAVFTVNDERDFHRSPAAAALAEGGFAVAFVAGRDAPGLFGRRVDAGGPLGGVFLIAATDPSCDLPEGGCAVSSPDVAARPGGGFVVVWEQESAIFGRLYEAGGVAAGAPFTVAAGTTESLRLEPAVAVLADGSLAVAYTAVEVSSGQLPVVFDEIRLARFDAAGAFVADVAASRFSGGLQANPAVAAADGRPFVFWESFGNETTGAGIFGRLDPEDAGRPELQVNTVIAGDQLWPAAAVEANGLVAAAWLDAPRNALAAQRLAPGLAYVGDEVAVEPAVLLGFTGDAPAFGRTRIAALADGTLVVAAAIAGTAADPDGGVAVGFVDPSPLADCFEDGRLICMKVTPGR